MKTIYEILYPFGCKTLEVAEDFETKFPYTEVAPDPSRDLMLQFFDVKSNVWKPVEYMASAEKIALLENFYTTVKADNVALTAKTGSMAQLNSKLMMNDLTIMKDIEALKVQLKPVENTKTETEAE